MNKHRILVVEDDEMIAEALTDILDSLGYRFMVASTGPEALERIKDQKIDLAIVDLELPIMPGIEVADKLTKLQPGIRVIFTTGYSDQEEHIDLSVPHYVDVMRKPFEIADLKTSVENALNTP